ncbi:sulfotransferase family cytosolic 1B member 1-like [Drosophila rhopaloa]|uniref:Sulfotransferase family cytosolic 1B member 1-like n=1 Tax=Drosophila rhopaloa TaxID=1041015 RepID=A0A6P4E2R7_DRORH|nr:sulfotransferase family cytosolic 1B member 1-like [Drosophila rhopaloa]
MYSKKFVGQGPTAPMIQLGVNGPNGLGPEWLPLKQDWKQRWCTLTGEYTDEFAKRIHDFKTRSTDVFVVSLMKTGSTWVQELAWLLLNKMDFQQARKSYGMERSPYLEHSGVISTTKVDSIDACDKLQSNPRLLKSHLPAQLLPRGIWKHGPKIIYVARNPKDVVVSTYHFLTGLNCSKCSLNEFVDYFIADKIDFTSYWAHVIDFYRMRDEDNIFFVTYEEMKRDLEDVIKRLSNFLCCEVLSKSEMEELINHLSFENMKKSKFGNHTTFMQDCHQPTNKFEFLRRGIVGSYEDELSSESQEKINQMSLSFLNEYGISESDIFGQI